MFRVVLGITYGLAVGLFNNYILFKTYQRARSAGQEPTSALGKLFLLRYAIDAVALLAVLFVVQDVPMFLGAGFSITVLGNIALYVVYRRKGGKFD